MKKAIIKLAFNILRKEYVKNYWRPAFTRLRRFGLEVRFVENGRIAMINLDPMNDLSKEER